METQNTQELRIELERLLQKQSQMLKEGLAGTVQDTEILKYELRQEVIREMWERLAKSASA